ncbi:MFS transporter [Streptomyces sp. WAC 01529]|uniref:MFS transporter n=1 Tax=Streptomyces sp. WAC 01529 TaxID=2203205 RepID=UPI000F6CAA0D|nr:MFS transporter [Streptomyces sp. WAC 01529]AZM51953.1 MFS transporter [Streptomyces sp. WAC 01529]
MTAPVRPDSTAGQWRRRLGLPDLTGHGRIVAATSLDTFGVGMFIPLSFLFFLLSTDLTVAQVGWGTSVATLLSVPFAPLAGSAVDRWGPRACLVANNVLAAAGYLCYLLVESLPSLVASMLVVLCAERLYWASWPAFVADLAKGAELDRWYAFTAAGKNASIALGGAAGGAVLATGWSGAPVLIVVLNAGTSVLTALLFMRPTRPRTHGDRSGPHGDGPPPGEDAARPPVGDPAATGRTAEETTEPQAGWGTILRDRVLLCLLASQAALTFGWLIPTVILPVYLVEVRDLPAWLPSTTLMLSSLLIVGCQTYVTSRLGAVGRGRVISWAAVLILGAVGLLAAVPALGGRTAIVTVILAVVLFTAGQMAATPAAVALSATAGPPRARGRFLALFNLTWTLSAVTGPALVGALIERHGAVLWAVLAALVALGGLGYRLTGRLAPDLLGSPRAEDLATDHPHAPVSAAPHEKPHEKPHDEPHEKEE